jgi:hypothetical protein
VWPPISLHTVRGMSRLSLALVITAGALAVPATAQAAYTVGPGPDVLLSDADQLTCDANCTLAQARYANEDLVVPSMPGTDHGVVVGYRIRGHGGQVRLRKLAIDGTGGTGGAATAWEELPGSDGTGHYAVKVPVKAGDALAVDITGDSQVAYFADPGDFGDRLLGWEPALASGQTRAADADITGYFGFSADVEPDVDGDGLGDETQDPCVDCHATPDQPGPSDPGPASPGPADPGTPAPADPYAEIRQSGPKVTIAGTASAAKRTVSITATNPYAFPVKGKLVLKQGRRAVPKAKVKLAAGTTKTVKLKVTKALARKLAKRKVKLTAAATLTGPVGKARTTTRKLTLAKPAKGGKGIDGVYHGSGATAGWTMVIRNGVVENFNGRTSLYCTKAHRQENVTFAMVGDDPDPRVGTDGSFAWEATSGYGFLKLKFSGTVSAGVAHGKTVVEDRSPIQGADPVTGMPRIEFEYCFAGQDFELRK